MKHQSEMEVWSSRTQAMDQEIRRANARLRHFRGVAASVMGDALDLWREIWADLQDPVSCEEILAGESGANSVMPEAERRLLLDKLHLLGIRIDYAKRLCEGAIGNPSHEEGEE